MSFFKDFKDDLSQAVNELMPGDDGLLKEDLGNDDDMVVNTLGSDLDVESELSKLDGLLEKVSKDVNSKRPMPQKPAKAAAINKIEAAPVKPVVPEPVKTVEKPVKEKEVKQPAEEKKPQITVEEKPIEKKTVEEKPVAQKKPQAAVKPEAGQSEKEKAAEEKPVKETLKSLKKVEEDKIMSELNNELEQENTIEESAPAITVEETEISDEISVITEGTHIKGNMESNGSLDIRGEIEGNVSCNGKLVVTGTINGNSKSSEFFADAAKIEGEVVSTGTVKVGIGSVIIGNISATSAVIAGAIKGDIDVKGPVVVDTSAVVMGNIKSRSVQINNGAVIEGFCSQAYAEVDVESLFGSKKAK